MATPPPVALREPVQALILDIDGTIKGSFDPSAQRVANTISRLAQSRAAARGLDAAQVEAQVWAEIDQTDPRTWMHSNPAVLGELLPCLKAATGETFEKDDARIAHQFQTERDASLTLFDGVPEVIQKARAAGAAVIIHTDAPPSRVAYEFYRMGIDPDLLDEIHTRQEPDLPAPPFPVASEEAAYTDRLRGKMIQEGQIKPNPAVVDSIVERYGLDRDRTLFVGDHACDGLTAGGAGVAFAWQRQGSEVLPRTREIQQRLVGDRYPLGPEPQEARLTAEGCWPPSVTLDQGFHQLADLRYGPAPGRDKAPASAAPAAPKATQPGYGLG